MNTDTTSIANNFSPSIALAQSARAIDDLANSLLIGLCVASLPVELKRTGIAFEGLSNLVEIAPTVKAHGLLFKGIFEHVWIEGKGPSKELGGRIRFRGENFSSSDAVTAYDILFDLAGNVRFGKEEYFSEKISDSGESYARIKTKMAVDLLNMMHECMPTVKLGC
jgi:hypothetical protein